MKNQGEIQTKDEKEALFIKSNHKKSTYVHDQSLTFTPPVSRKLRQYALQYETTIKSKFRESVGRNGISKWIMKSSMKVVCEGPLSHKEIEERKTNEMSKIKAYTKAQEMKFNDVLKINTAKKSKINYLLEKYQHAKMKNKMLKKQIVLEDLKRTKRLWMKQKQSIIDEQYLQLNKNIQQMESKIYLSIEEHQNFKRQLLESKKSFEKTNVQLSYFNRQLENIENLIRIKKEKIQQLAKTTMPNQREIESCMFSIGILNEQIYILYLEKSIKKSFNISNEKVNQNLNKKIIAQRLGYSQTKRQILIDCKDSSIVTFKVFSFIYMHCRSLYLPNLLSLMKKTTYFSDEFHNIYDRENYKRYMKKLIEKYKGNTSYDMKMNENDTERQKIIQVTVVASTNQIGYFNWILDVLERKDKYFLLKFDNTEVHIDIMTIDEVEDLEKAKRERLKHINLLKVTLGGSERN